MASARKLGLKRELIFQQDHDPNHTAYIIDDFLEQNGIEKLPWPAQSPDLNPIEHLWDEMERRMRAKCPKNKNEMKKLFVETWNNIGSDVTKKLVESMPRRIRQVILNKGGPTRY
jgi:transposase